jgi:hypothetical protein
MVSTIDPDTTRAILFFLSEGRSPRQILAEHPELAEDDIPAAAAEALRVLELGETREDRIARVRRKHPHAFEPWTQGEDKQLVDEWRAGAPLAALARAFGRPSGAIRMRLEKLGEDPRRAKKEPAA